MPVNAEWIRYGDQIGYFAFPDHAAQPLPAVVVIQEVMGVNAQIEDVTRRLAAAGYAALAPDLFAVDGKRPPALSTDSLAEAMAFMATMAPASRFDPAVRAAEMAKLEPAKRQRVEESFGAMFSAPGSMGKFVAPLRRAVSHLAERPETAGRKVGCVGFCMGGGLSALLACEEPGLAAAAVFYGSSPPAEKVAAIYCPIIAFYGANDQRVNAGIPGFAEAMRNAGKSFEHQIYEGANHAFFNDAGASYEVNAARDSFARLLTFFATTLT